MDNKGILKMFKNLLVSKANVGAKIYRNLLRVHFLNQVHNIG